MRLRSIVFGLTITFCMLTGCVQVYRAPVLAYPSRSPNTKFPLHIALVINDALREAQLKKSDEGTVYHVGQSLSTNVISICGNTFESVDIVPSLDAGANLPVDAIMSVVPISIDRSIGPTSFSTSFTTIRVRWTLTDKSRAVIWSDAVTGKASGSTGWSNREKVLGKAMESLVQQSYDAICSSEQIKNIRRP